MAHYHVHKNRYWSSVNFFLATLFKKIGISNAKFDTIIQNIDEKNTVQGVVLY